jgi:hypothetical protein
MERGVLGRPVKPGDDTYVYVGKPLRLNKKTPGIAAGGFASGPFGPEDQYRKLRWTRKTAPMAS